MALILVPATAFTLATLVLAVLWRLGLALFRRAAPRFWYRTLKGHAGLFALHALVTVPLTLGLLLSRVGTRGDERSYSGPRIAADGTWQLQSRDSLRAEADGRSRVDPAALAEARGRAVTFTASDGVPLRAFLVPPAPDAAGSGPRFVAVLVHGLYRGALEIETPGEMFRSLGGEVLLLEQRNHGGSGHAPATFGRDEALDVLAAVDFVRSTAGGRPLVLYGVSMGTAAAALATPRIPDLAGLVLDAPMDDLVAAARRELASGTFWFSIREPWASTILFSARHLAGVPLHQVQPRSALERLDPGVAVLLIGAGHDARMPPDSVRAIFEVLPTPADRKELWIEPEATHGKVWVTAPEEYRRRLARLCDTALGPYGVAEEEP